MVEEEGFGAANTESSGYTGLFLIGCQTYESLQAEPSTENCKLVEEEGLAAVTTE